MQLDSLLISFLFIVARVTGLIMRMPAISQPNIPMIAKIAIIMLVSLYCMSFAKISSTGIANSHLIVGIFINLIYGYFLGFIASLVINIAQVAGEVIDIQTGLNSAVVIAGGIQATVFSRTMESLAVLIFLYFGGLEICLLSLKHSFVIFPITSYDLSRIGLSIGEIITLTREALEIGVILSAPILVIIVFVDIILAIMSRVAQQINPFQLSYSLKPLIGILILLAILPLMQSKLIKLSEKGNNIFGVGDLPDKPDKFLEEKFMINKSSPI